jgi:hypothetical protein
MCEVGNNKALSFKSALGSVQITVEYQAEDGFITPIRCVFSDGAASLLDDGNHFSPVQIRVWQRQAEADYRRRVGADYEPDPADVFDNPAGSAVRAINSYFDRVDAAVRWGA